MVEGPHFDAAERAVQAALDAGASYADARVVFSRDESLLAQDGELQGAGRSESAGIGVRALLGSSWGFAATNDLGDSSSRDVGVRATATAEASGRVAGPAVELADVPVVEDHHRSAVDEDPFAVPLSEKVELLLDVSRTMYDAPGVAVARGFLTFWDTQQWFVSSQGHRISQHLTRSGGGCDATAVGEQETQRRSYPQSFGHYEVGGYEVVRRFHMRDHAARVADEAAALLTAPECPQTTTDLVLEGSQLALQIHESVGHAIELDRILGWEAAFAGTSFLPLPELRAFRYGSELMNVVADATVPGALATFAYDDEGTPAQRVPIVDRGTWVGVLSGRDSAHVAGLQPGGMVRGDGYNRLPMVRMTNVGLLPGEDSLDEIVADTRDGVLMATNRSWSIDDKRLNFQFGCEIAWEIKDGQRGRMLRNPTYTGITPRFWASLDRLSSGRRADDGRFDGSVVEAVPDDYVAWGVPNCGKGQPVQTAGTGHMAAPARFRDVRVGVRG